MRRRLHTWTTWLVLAVYVLSGLAPARELVVCVEPDGSIVLEAALPSGCTPCGGAEDECADGVQASLECCPCVDIPLPTRGEDPEARPKLSGGIAEAAQLCAATRGIASARACEPRHTHAPPARPRPPPGLASIRTVILRV